MHEAQEKYNKYLYILPLFILLAVIYIHPVLRAFYFSFYKLPFGTAKGIFTGLGNYINLFKDPVFMQALQSSFIWALGNLILQSTIAMFIAVMLNQNFKCKKKIQYE